MLFTTVLILLLPVFSLSRRKLLSTRVIISRILAATDIVVTIFMLVIWRDISSVIYLSFPTTVYSSWGCNFSGTWRLAIDLFRRLEGSMCLVPSDTNFSTRLPWKR